MPSTLITELDSKKKVLIYSIVEYNQYDVVYKDNVKYFEEYYDPKDDFDLFKKIEKSSLKDHELGPENTEIKNSYKNQF